MWSNNNKMKKKTKIIILIVLSFLTAVSLWTAANFKKISDSDIFNIEED
jgi:flagellar basal body-associated protein FliL